MNPWRELRGFATGALWRPVGRQQGDEGRAVVRRRVVAATTFVVGVALVTLTLRIRPGDPLFYPVGIALAAVWTAGAFLSGPVGVGRIVARRGRTVVPVLQPFVVGLVLLALFLAGAAMVAVVPLLREPVEGLLDKARYASLPVVWAITAVNGVAEELFFRGALQPAIPARYAVPVTTLLYTATTVGSGVPLLTLAAFLLGMVTCLQRRMTGGVLAPVITHVTWSTGMLFLLPSVLDLAGRIVG